MTTTIKFNFEKPSYQIVADWPGLLSEPMMFRWTLSEQEVKEIEAISSDEEIQKKEMIARLMKHALWQLQAYMFNTIQKK